MTANAMEEDREAALKCGMNAHLSKPVDIDVLIPQEPQALQVRRPDDLSGGQGG
ncbi:MAG: hypothetical protein NC489_33090 [Ruminococcus flavefaciens]|nr:hypothetical protein [Ruminococcus flavefaciens]